MNLPQCEWDFRKCPEDLWLHCQPLATEFTASGFQFRQVKSRGLWEIAYVRRKTGKGIRVPLHPQLATVFEKMPRAGLDEYFWPEEAQRYLTTGASSLSQEFYDLMASAGIVEKRDAKKLTTGKGRNSKRDQTPIGFHNLRHTFISMLKIKGANEATAKELVGHRSAAISDHYTHLPREVLATAIGALPRLEDPR